MSKIYKSADELIGKTPLLELSSIEKKLDLKAKIIAKVELFNPAGSAKDRVARQMIDDAEKEGKLKCGSVIIEPTSGNTGIGIASIAASKGYKAIIVMPDTMSVERIQLIKAFGAEIVLTEGQKGMSGAIEKAEELHREIPGSIIAGQFVNPSNPKAHYLSTGPEIFDDTDGKIDFFVAGVGTGGTIMGVSEYPVPVNTRMILEKGLRLFGTSRSGREDFEKTIEMYQKHPQIVRYLQRLVSNVVEVEKFSDIKKAFEVDLKKPFGKTIMHWNI